MHKDPPVSKVFYRPIEAAIRWAGLLRYYQDILFAISSPRELSLTLECPRWDELRLCDEMDAAPTSLGYNFYPGRTITANMEYRF